MTRPFALLAPFLAFLTFLTSLGALAELGYCSSAQEPIFMKGQSQLRPAGTVECPRTFTKERVRAAFGLVQHADLISSASFTSTELLKGFNTLAEGNLIDEAADHIGREDHTRGSRARLDSRIRCTMGLYGVEPEGGRRHVEELVVDGEAVMVGGMAEERVWTVGVVPWGRSCWAYGGACNPSGGKVFVVATYDNS